MAASALSLAVACGGGTGSVRMTADELREVEAPAASAPSYQTASSQDDAVIGPAASAVRSAVAAAQGADDGDPLSGDGRLALLAGWVAENLGEGGRPPPHEVVEFFAHHLGVVEPVHLLTLGAPDEPGLESGLRESVEEFLARQSYTHYGVTVVRRERLLLAVMVLSARWVELRPVPRRVDAGATIRLQGRLRAPYRGALVVVARPDGDVERVPAGDGRDFEVPVTMASAGVHRVELIAHGPRGESVVANFPLFVGVDVPDRVVVETPIDEANADPGDVGAALLSLLNRDRSAQGLEALGASEEVAEVAAAHSRDMVENGFIGHTSPTTGTVVERVERGGIRSQLILENIGRGYAPGEIHRGLMDSPGHRANILNPDVTHVGIGVVREPEGDRTAYVATQVFVRLASEIDLDGAAEELLELINEARAARRVSGLELDEDLSAAAQRGAEQFFRRPNLSQQNVVDEATRSLNQLSGTYRRVGGVMAVVSQLREAATLEPAMHPGAHAIGIGVAQGTRPDTPENAIAIVMVIGWRR